MLSAQLLLHIAEELKLPFLQIARHGENASEKNHNELKLVQVVAENALRLLDNYTLGVSMNLESYEQKLEPVSIPSVLYEASNQLRPIAKRYGVELNLKIKGRYNPVMADKQGLQAALVSLGSALIEAMPARGAQQLSLSFATHHGRNGIVAGIYGNNRQLSKDILKKGRQLQHGRQPFVSLSHTSGAGIIVADSLLEAMNLQLYSSRHDGLYGLGVAMQPTHQLELV